MAHNQLGRAPFEEWLSKVKWADWRYPEDIKKTFPAADLLGKGSCRAIFDISGNRYRLIAKYSFGDEVVRLYVCWIGTHSEYDVLCKKGLQYTAFDY